MPEAGAPLEPRLILSPDDSYGKRGYWDQPFQRHPGCDCTQIAVPEDFADRIRPWVRMFAAQADSGEPTSTGQQGSAPSQPAPQEPTGAKEEAGVDKPTEAESDEDDNPDGRDSKALC